MYDDVPATRSSVRISPTLLIPDSPFIMILAALTSLNSYTRTSPRITRHVVPIRPYARRSSAVDNLELVHVVGESGASHKPFDRHCRAGDVVPYSECGCASPGDHQIVPVDGGCIVGEVGSGEGDGGELR